MAFLCVLGGVWGCFRSWPGLGCSRFGGCVDCLRFVGRLVWISVLRLRVKVSEAPGQKYVYHTRLFISLGVALNKGSLGGGSIVLDSWLNRRALRV